MAQVSVNYPVVGQANSTEDQKVVSALTALVTAINSLDDANIAAGANINGSKLLNTSVAAAKIESGILPPTGALMPYAGSSAPTGYLICDGSAVSRNTYSTLYNLITSNGTVFPYGSGDGSTTFNLPDLRGRMPVGLGTHSTVDALGENDGAAVANRRPAHSHSGTTNPAGAHTPTGSVTGGGEHGHTWSQAGSVYTGSNFGSGANRNAVTSVVWETAYISNQGSHSHGLSMNQVGNHDHPVTVGSTGGTTDSPSFVVVNYIIKT